MGEGGGGVWRCKWGEELGGVNYAGVRVSDGGGRGRGGEGPGFKDPYLRFADCAVFLITNEPLCGKTFCNILCKFNFYTKKLLVVT